MQLVLRRAPNVVERCPLRQEGKERRSRELKRLYAKPQLVEYGRVDQITLGIGGTMPDNLVILGQQIANVNNNCSSNLGDPNLVGLVCS
jgi:hypothetical protein